jgi:hypothetical protein
MPSSRLRVLPNQSSVCDLNFYYLLVSNEQKSTVTKTGCLYGLGYAGPRIVNIPLASGLSDLGVITPYLLAEAALGSQLFIHDCVVEIYDRRHRRQRMLLFFTRHKMQPNNIALTSIDPDIVWTGQILVMKLGRTGKSVVHLRACDKGLASDAIIRYTDFLIIYQQCSRRVLQLSDSNIADHPSPNSDWGLLVIY